MTALPAQAGRIPAPAASVACNHCGLDVPKGLVEPDAGHQFCCAGCRAVFSIIQGHGLDRYYTMRRALERDKSAAPRAVADYAAFDDPVFLDRYATDEADGTRRATLALAGVHCAACVWLIERLGRCVPGVVESRASFTRSTVDVRWDPAAATFADVARGLHALGYPPGPPRGDRGEAQRLESRRQLVRLGVAGALAGNIMLVTVALYAGVFDGIEPLWFNLFRWIAAGLGVLSLAWPGRVFFRGAIASLRARSPSLDVPIAIALLAGGAWGLACAVRGTGEIYFDSLATLTFFLLVGRFVQSQQQRRAADAVELLLTLTPNMVRILNADGSRVTKPVEAVAQGDLAEVIAGETLPVDGEVADGDSEVDQAILTGESRPVARTVGDAVWAGSVNLSGRLIIRITAAGETTRAAKLMRLVAGATTDKAPIVQLADRIAARFVIVVTVLACLTAALWWHAGPQLAIDHATALLIVTCPCALGLATPLVLSASIGRLARSGVLVKGGAQLERLGLQPGFVLLDKTGTVTTGEMTAVCWTVPEDLAAQVRALESGSSHPIARAIAASGPASTDPVEQTSQTCGGGIAGRVGGRDIAAGSERYLEQLEIAVSERHRAWAASVAAGGGTPVLIASNGVLVGGVELRDTPRPEAASVVDALRSLGWRIGMLSGDHPAVVRDVASRLGIKADLAQGGVTPEGKLRAVREASAAARGAPVVMIGDGVNDAAALAAADVGIAAAGGADASLDAAGVSIQRGGLDAVETLLAGSHRAVRRIRLCMAVSLTYNATAASLAIAGLIDPLLAAVLMPASSLTVVAIAASAGRPLERRTEGGGACP